ncbi:MAG: hypothetical protein ACXVR1_10845 [Solirubrobacteraceae bacterium]
MIGRPVAEGLSAARPMADSWLDVRRFDTGVVYLEYVTTCR